MSWIDSHVHLTHFDSDDEIDKVLTESIEKGGKYFFQGGIDPDDWQKQTEIKMRYPNTVGMSFGLHPWFVDLQTNEICELAFSKLKKIIHEADALGECGLDYSRKTDHSHQSRQVEYFRKQLDLAQESTKPLVLHIVSAHHQTLEMLKNRTQKHYRGLIHSFSGNLEIANQYIDLGFLISVGPGVIARDGFFALKKMIGKVDLNHIVLETDAPDQLKKPTQILEVAQAISELKAESTGETQDEILQVTEANFRRVFQC
ncbi:MAG: TatD family hydrolase [Xanthomonadaceae bacterium]|nr:TatD family hydrolase [Xanthomonadaceae bacterium]